MANKVISKLFLLAIFVCSASLLLPENYRNLSLFFMTIVSVVLLFKRGSLIAIMNKTLVVNILLFLVLLTSLLYTQDLEYGLKRITVLVSLLVMPLTFFLYTLHFSFNSSKILIKIYKTFYLSNIVFFLCVLGYNYLNGFINEFLFQNFNERLNSELWKYSMHPIYASLYIGVSLFLSVKIYKTTTKNIEKTIVLVGNIILLLFLALLARKGAIIIIVILLIFLLFRNFDRKYLWMFLLLFLILSITTSFINPLRERYLEFLEFLTSQENGKIGSTTIRLGINKCGLDLVFDRPLFGYGIGDTKEILISCYSKSEEVFRGKYYNSHNQYISVWLAAGLLGLFSLLLMLIFNLKKLYTRKLFVEFSVLLLFIFTLLIENILERQNGVMLFSFFLNLFAFFSWSEKSKKG